jgi:hypothetical protein
MEMQMASMQMNQAVMQGLKGASGVMAKINADMKNPSELQLNTYVGKSKAVNT